MAEIDRPLSSQHVAERASLVGELDEVAHPIMPPSMSVQKGASEKNSFQQGSHTNDGISL